MARKPEVPVRITADRKPFQRGLKGAERDADVFADRMARNGRLMRGWAAAAVIGVGAAAALARSTLEAADSIDKAARAAAIGAERLQTLRFAAEQSGISTEKMDAGLAKFNVTLGRVASGMETSSSSVTRAFAALGLSADELAESGRSTEETLDIVLERLAGVKDGSEQAAIAAQLFGRSAGPQMRNLLANGIDGLRELEKASVEAGAVIDEALVTRGVEIADKWAAVMHNMAQNARQFALQAATAIDNAFGFTDSGRLESQRALLSDLADERNDLLAQLESEEARFKRSAVGGGDLELERLRQIIQATEEDMNIVNQGLLDLQNAKEERESRLAALLDGQDPITSGDLPGPGGGSQSSQSDAEYQRLAERWKSKLELLTEKQGEERAILMAAREQRLIDEETFQQQLTKLETDHAKAREQVARLEAAAKVNTVLGAGSDVLGALGAFNDKALQASKVFGSAQALISTYQGAAEALKLPFPANIAAAAAVTVKGLGLVSAIRSVSKSGGGGGSPGGASVAGAAPQAAQPLQATVSGFTKDQLFTGDMIPPIFDALQKEAGDRGIQFSFSS